MDNDKNATMMPEIFETFKRYHSEIFHTITVPKKTVLLRQGEIADRIYGVNKGALRLWHSTPDGRDITIQFFFNGQIVSSFESFYLNVPSNFSLETISDCALSYARREDIIPLLKNSGYTQHFLTDYACHRLITYINLFLSRIEHSPEDRYRLLLHEHPELLELVPHHYIASYLGISATSLSRIRRRIAEERNEKN